MEQKCHYPEVKKLPALFNGITSKHKSYFYFIVLTVYILPKQKLKQIHIGRVLWSCFPQKKKEIIMKYYHSSKSIKHQFEIYGDF